MYVSDYRQAKLAEAGFVAKQQEAAGIVELANAEFVRKQKEAEGLIEMSKAYGAMADVLGGPQGLMQYLMIQSGTFENLAKANAQAINGLQPKITVWNTGSGGEAAGDTTAPIRNIMQSLPPLFSTIHDQTGMAPPSWLAQMPPQQGQQGNEVAPAEDLKAKNGFLANKAAGTARNGSTA